MASRGGRSRPDYNFGQPSLACRRERATAVKPPSLADSSCTTEDSRMRALMPRPALLLLALVLTAPAADAQYKRLPTVDDVLDLVQVSDAQISPDGARVLYTRSELKSW